MTIQKFKLPNDPNLTFHPLKGYLVDVFVPVPLVPDELVAAGAAAEPSLNCRKFFICLFVCLFVLYLINNTKM